jgi:AbiV family abortive infection protein
LGELARLALVNAAELAGDAQVLLDAERYPRAFALATLAAEELGKHYLCVSWSGFDPADRKVWRRFWTAFYGHTPKLENWIGYVIDLVDIEYESWQEMWKPLPEGTQSQHEVKLLASRHRCKSEVA